MLEGSTAVDRAEGPGDPDRPLALEEMTREQLLELLIALVPSRPHDWEPDERVESSSWLDEFERPQLGAVAWLDELTPSGRLLSELEGMPADVRDSDYDAVELVAQWQRIEAHCAAGKRLAAAALARQEAMAQGLAGLERLREAGNGRGVVVSDPNIAGDELALRLGVTKRAARRWIASGQAMTHAGIPTMEAFVAGEIDAVKADMILEVLTDLSPDAALDVQERVLEKASYVPSGTVRRELSKACAEVAPEEFEERCADARSARRVDRQGRCRTAWPRSTR